MRALVLGDARTVWEEATAALAMFEPDAVAATNNAGIAWPGRLDYWCTLHPQQCTSWVGIDAAVRQRVAAGRNRPQTWAHKASRGVDRHVADWAGSSGLFAVRVLLHEGFTHIVLAGVPMNRDGAHFYDEGRPWESAGSFHKGWEKHMAQLRPHVRSMSGWTRVRLGGPTPEWLGQEQTSR